MQVASKVENLHSEFGHAKPLGFRVIRYVRDGRTDGQTTGPTGGSIIMTLAIEIISATANYIAYWQR